MHISRYALFSLTVVYKVFGGRNDVTNGMSLKHREVPEIYASLTYNDFKNKHNSFLTPIYLFIRVDYIVIYNQKHENTRCN